jgi:hypothetical protein
MKCLLRVLFVLALFLGFSSHARAAGVDYHVMVLDPTCITNPSICLVESPSVTFPVQFSSSTCAFQGLPSDPTTDGCLEIINASTTNFTSLNISFPGLDSSFDCPTTGTTPASIFTSSNCTSSGGSDQISFSGGPGLPPTVPMIVDIVITDQGIKDGLTIGSFVGTGIVNPTPEPDSLLLLSTGAMMLTAGMFLRRQRRLPAFSKK